jgi:hypothetical protein
MSGTNSRGKRIPVISKPEMNPGNVKMRFRNVLFIRRSCLCCIFFLSDLASVILGINAFGNAAHCTQFVTRYGETRIFRRSLSSLPRGVVDAPTINKLDCYER